MFFCLLFSVGKRRHEYREEKEPEWFTSGPTCQTDTIELRGFGDPENETANIVKDDIKELDKCGRSSIEGERGSKGMHLVQLTFDKLIVA